MTSLPNITPERVFPILNKHILVDGFDGMVIDLKKSQGSYIFDSLKNRRYLDLFSFFATAPIGHNHPDMLKEDFKEKILNVAIMKPSNSDFYTVEMAEFVELFSKYAIPEGLPNLFLISGGALAVENALKAAFDWKVRKNFAKGYKQEKGTQIMHFKQAFHGRTGYTLSLTNTADPRKTKYYPKFNWPRITNPKIRFPMTADHLEKVAALEKQALAEMKAAVHENPDDIAAILIEPIQGEGGDNHFRKEFLQQLRTFADENDILLIFDEVQTGVGLTGKMWCFQHFGMQPDMITFGKKTQVCGFLCSDRIHEVADNVFKEASRINSTWGGNLVDMVRFGQYLQIIDRENLIENAKNIGEYFLRQLQNLEQEFADHICNVRGRGLMIAFDLPDETFRNHFLYKLFENGSIALTCGHASIRFRPALNITREFVDEAMSIVTRSLEEVLHENGEPTAAKVEDKAQFEL
ncbi:MAG: L-lysine 6-transaminase [bacterium]